MVGLIGRKLGMTQIFNEDGTVVPVTVVEAGPCPVVQILTSEKHGYDAVQLGFGEKKEKHASRAERGHAARVGLEAAPVELREFRVEDPAEYEPGQALTVEQFEVGQRVKVTGTSKGRGFQGVVKRHGFAGRPGSHGHSASRTPGSMGPGTDPSRVIKGKKLPGQMGNVRKTIRNLTVERIDAERNLLFIRGAVPGSRNSTVLIRTA